MADQLPSLVREDLVDVAQPSEATQIAVAPIGLEPMMRFVVNNGIHSWMRVEPKVGQHANLAEQADSLIGWPSKDGTIRGAHIARGGAGGLGANIVVLRGYQETTLGGIQYLGRFARSKTVPSEPRLAPLKASTALPAPDVSKGGIEEVTLINGRLWSQELQAEREEAELEKVMIPVGPWPEEVSILMEDAQYQGPELQELWEKLKEKQQP